MTELEKITITFDEVQDPKVDKLVAQNAEARGPVVPANREAPRVPLYYNPMFIYALAGGLAAFGAWSVLEPTIHHTPQGGEEGIGLFALFPTMGAAVGLMLAVSDALLSRNLTRAFLCGSIGLGIGFLVGLVGHFVAGFLFMFAIAAVAALMRGSQSEEITGIAFFVLMVGRSMAWTLAAMGMGLGQGVALRSKKLVMNGLVGGVIGGFLGGMAFDPIGKVVGGGGASRGFGMVIIGTAVGFFIGLVESMAKDAWLYMKAGPLAGKQFVIYKDPTVLGSSPKCDVYLFKDAAIEPRHAELRAVGTRYQIKDLGTKQGIYVNGRRVDSHMLQPGDQVVLGETVLEYAERPKK